MTSFERRAILLMLMLGTAGMATACNITFSQIDFSRLEQSGAPDAGLPRYTGGGAYPPVGPGR